VVKAAPRGKQDPTSPELALVDALFPWAKTGSGTDQDPNPRAQAISLPSRWRRLQKSRLELPEDSFIAERTETTAVRLSDRRA
jgi:hypothetical protein